ncbi:hypothetical protein E3P81_00471 [Wallemia ichthyophaga]|nr:hypothetical protein E3P97_00473 [Wallemia ichthyophaga]TIB32370.1 hypothetical protein E3P85_01890 [Wallemia ichthyophaga]TIB50230.1 hypothetical protein E3P82_00563 [Wallemia ichthyophaga]TIB54006.1 hypothetical protein E3P81_00471 [Wallemia ichthyophaga]TIB56446.1 hypothetical protein E3P80_00564 [Wallemia ichthyophaga]
MSYEKLNNEPMNHLESERFEMSANPNDWGARNWQNEEDDYLHNPTSRDGAKASTGSIFTIRGLINLGLLSVLVAALLMLFAGYPIYDEFKPHHPSTSSNYAKFNSTGQVEWTKPNRHLIDPDTHEDFYTRQGFGNDTRKYQLVFSDEFEQDGRTFAEGEDPYFEAQDLHYWGTNNLEWYSPRQATTNDGNLVLTLSQSGPYTDNLTTHGLNYAGAMIHSWNKFCFTGGYVSARIMLPGYSDVWGLWPAFWTMANIGRAGYGASLEGMWPYSYDSCDVGTLQNQTLGEYPENSYNTGGKVYDGYTAPLSFSNPQRLSRCTCENEDHPGPQHEDGTWKGRAAYEIDIVEAQVSQVGSDGQGGGGTGTASMSGQWCPFNLHYEWDHDIIFIHHNKTLSPNDTFDELNSYQGGNQQMSTSVVVKTDQDAYELSGGEFSNYGVQINTGTGNDANIGWTVDDELRWMVYGDAVGPDERTAISERVIMDEPLYIIFNLGISENFDTISDRIFAEQNHYVMKVDWVRVYQPENDINIGCDPKEMPTAAYIDSHKQAYSNQNLTTWKQYMDQYPDEAGPVKNALMHQDDEDCQMALNLAYETDPNLRGKKETDEKKLNMWN